MSNPALHWDAFIAGGHLIPAFEKVPGGGACKCWHPTRVSISRAKAGYSEITNFNLHLAHASRLGSTPGQDRTSDVDRETGGGQFL
jgi:hypothetical protein